jgi:hypothetical protein
MIIVALLPPMPLSPRIALGILGMLFAGMLSLVFRRAHFRLLQWVTALALAPAVIVFLSILGLNSGQKTEYVFCGALVGIVCVRGQRPFEPIPAFASRSLALFAAFALCGPAIGLLFHYFRYKAGLVQLVDEWEIGLSLEDGVIASAYGCILAGILVCVSANRDRNTHQLSPAGSPIDIGEASPNKALQPTAAAVGGLPGPQASWGCRGR